LVAARYYKGQAIDAGGQGQVFKGKAEDGTAVAIKYMTVSPSAEANARALKRFEREIKFQASLKHPGIMPVLAMNVTSPAPFFVMPIATMSLRFVLKTSPSGLDEAKAVTLFSKILEAISYAHSEGVVHRDLKPENILLIGDKPIVADFGFGLNMLGKDSALTDTHAGLGSVYYSAPEQWVNAHEVDQRADIFALGRIFHEMLCGKMAYPAAKAADIPTQFRYLVRRATDNDPDKRFADIAEMQRELAVWAGGTQQLLQPSEQATELIEAVARGDSSKVPLLIRVLVDNADDIQLYLKVLPFMPEAVIHRIAAGNPEAFGSIVRAFDEHAEGGHAWSFVDVLANFLRSLFRPNEDLEVGRLIIRRLLVLAHDHNRFYARTVLLSVVQAALEKNPNYGPVIASVLRNDPVATDFSRAVLSSVSLPAEIMLALRT
jgi:serine/threonine protein kinase